MEVNAPHCLQSPHSEQVDHGRPGTPFSESLPRPAGYGFDNYDHVFQGSDRSASLDEDDGGMEQLVADMDRAGVAVGYLVGARNAELGTIKRQYSDRFICFATLNPMDGMRAVRELERLVKEDGVGGLRVNALYNCLLANDRRYYPLYAKCVELDVPVRIYTAMNYANDRPYDLGHPRYIDDVAVDFGLGAVPAVRQYPAPKQDHDGVVALSVRYLLRRSDRGI
jgi:hypothetical protein